MKFRTVVLFCVCLYSCVCSNVRNRGDKDQALDPYKDSLFVEWYLNFNLDSIMGNRDDISTPIQKGILALAFIELDSNQSAERLLPEFIQQGQLGGDIPDSYNFYQALACYRLAENYMSDPNILGLLLFDLEKRDHKNLLYLVEYAYHMEARISQGLDYEFTRLSDSLIHSYPNYLRVVFLKGIYQYNSTYYKSAVPLLTNCYYAGYQKVVTGYFLYEYYSTITIVADSIQQYGEYQHEIR